MKQVISTERLPIKLWLSDIEEGALEQAKNLANLPFAFRHIAIMPDSHQGYGMPIGAVLATENVVIPNAVGVDIGCGMRVVKTHISAIDREDLQKIVNSIKQVIPVGFKRHKTKQSYSLIPKRNFVMPIVEHECENSLTQIGTLGGGNHFIEIQKDDDGFIWVMIHSGSRNLGYKVANHYNNAAKELNEKWYSSVPSKYQLAFLPLNSKEGSDYFNEMNYCVDFAKANRELMMHRIMQYMVDVLGSFKFEEYIDIAHNYASIENHFNRNVIIHRKGATRAYKDQIGIIPGSQGTSSYIVKGKGNKESFMSCSHGAGRKMGRKEAQRVLNLEEQKKILDSAGIIHNMTTTKDLDEAPGSYKDISEVMKNQQDLVDIVTELKPLAVIKG